MPTLTDTASSLHRARALALAALALLAAGGSAARAQKGDAAAIAAGEVAVQCQGDAVLTDHLDTLRKALADARATLGRRRVFLERVKAMDLDRVTRALALATSDARTDRKLNTPSAAGDVAFQAALRESEAELDLLMEAATLASIGDRLNPARNVYSPHIYAAAQEVAAFEISYRSSLKNCYDRNGESMLAASERKRDIDDGIASVPVAIANTSRPPAPARGPSAPPPPAAPTRNPYDAEEAPLSGALQMTPMSEADTRAMAGVASGGREGRAPSTRLDLESFSGRYSDGVYIFLVTGRGNLITVSGRRPGAELSIQGLNCTAPGNGAVCQGEGYSQDDYRRIAFAGRLTAFRQGGTITLSITLNGVTLVSGQAQPTDTAYLNGTTLNFVMRPN